MANVLQVLFEAVIVGVMLVLLTAAFFYILPEKINMWFSVFLVGATFHLLCEITGINRYYVDMYCKSK